MYCQYKHQFRTLTGKAQWQSAGTDSSTNLVDRNGNKLSNSNISGSIEKQVEEKKGSANNTFTNNVHPSSRLKGYKKERFNYSPIVTRILWDWFDKHLSYPYPDEDERIELCKQTRLTRKQLRIWFINARKVTTNIFLSIFNYFFNCDNYQ